MPESLPALWNSSTWSPAIDVRAHWNPNYPWHNDGYCDLAYSRSLVFDPRYGPTDFLPLFRYARFVFDHAWWFTGDRLLESSDRSMRTMESASCGAVVFDHRLHCFHFVHLQWQAFAHPRRCLDLRRYRLPRGNDGPHTLVHVLLDLGRSRSHDHGCLFGVLWTSDREDTDEIS